MAVFPQLFFGALGGGEGVSSQLKGDIAIVVFHGEDALCVCVCVCVGLRIDCLTDRQLCLWLPAGMLLCVCVCVGGVGFCRHALACSCACVAHTCVFVRLSMHAHVCVTLGTLGILIPTNKPPCTGSRVTITAFTWRWSNAS